MSSYKVGLEPEKLEDRKHGVYYLCRICGCIYRCIRGKIECPTCKGGTRDGGTY